MTSAPHASDDRAEIQALQQALLRALYDGNTIAISGYEGSPVLYHDGHTFVHVGRTGHGAAFYEVIRGEPDALALLGLAAGLAEAVRDGSVPTWSGVNASPVDPWRAMLGHVRPGRPASPWDAAFRRATPMQRAALIMATSLGMFIAIGAVVYVKEEVLGRGRPHPALTQPPVFAPPGAAGNR